MNRVSHPDTLDLAALLCSRLCHDVINPLGAIVTGVEMLSDEQDDETRALARDLIAKSAEQASATLRFLRLAFGASSQDSEIDLAAVERAARDALELGRTTLIWSGARRPLDKVRTKILLNLLLVAAGCVPRGGRISVEVLGDHAAPRFRIVASGPGARLPENWAEFLQGVVEQPIDARSVQVYYTGELIRAAGLTFDASNSGENVALEAR